MQGSSSNAPKDSIIINWVILTICATLIIVTNLYVILQTKRSLKMKQSVSKFLLANQAIADLLVGLVYVPAEIIDHFAKVDFLKYVVCFVFFNGLFARCIIAFDRFVSVTRPLCYKRIMTIRRAKLALQVLICVTILFDFMPLTWLWASKETNRKADKYFQFSLLLITISALIALLFVYAVIFYKARKFIKSKISCNKKRKEWFVHIVSSVEKMYLYKQRKLTIQFGILAISFILTYLPILYINFAVISQQVEYIPNNFVRISSYFFVLNALFSPIFSFVFNNFFKCTPKVV